MAAILNSKMVGILYIINIYNISAFLYHDNMVLDTKIVFSKWTNSDKIGPKNYNGGGNFVFQL